MIPSEPSPPASASLTRAVCSSPLGTLGLVARSGKLARVFLHLDPVAFPHIVELTFGQPGRESEEPFRETVRQLREYFEGRRLVFRLPLDLDQGAPFQRRVWRALTEIPYGETVTYKEIAGAVGAPSAARAVGAANGANPIPVIVPCHRVVAAGNRIGGYTGGLEVKRRLLRLEAETRARLRPGDPGEDSGGRLRLF